MADIMGLPLTTEDLLIRGLDKADWPLFSQLYTDAEVMKHISEPLESETIKILFEQRLEQWNKDKGEWLCLVIQTRLSDTPIGLIGLRSVKVDTAIAEIGFILDLAHSGQGYASQALKSLCKYAFYNLAFHKLTATCSIHNTASQRVLEKNNFIKEGVLRHNSIVDDNYIDDCIYGLLLHDVIYPEQSPL